MSYDIHLGEMNRNYTSNVVPLWDAAMPSLNLRDMNGMKGYQCEQQILAGIMSLAQNRHMYESLVRGEGWGDYAGALSVLVELYGNCVAFPDDEIRVHC